jgi:hypothetical protein
MLLFLFRYRLSPETFRYTLVCVCLCGGEGERGAMYLQFDPRIPLGRQGFKQHVSRKLKQTKEVEMTCSVNDECSK